MKRSIRLISVALLVAGFTACSISTSLDWMSDSSKRFSNSVSDSLESISDSVGSISRSISRSSGSGGDEAASLRYQMDIRTFTAAYIQSGGASRTEYLRDMGRIAEKHGITDWESEPATYVSVGEGLRKAGVSGDQYSTFEKSLGGVSPELRRLLRSGYESYPAL